MVWIFHDVAVLADHDHCSVIEYINTKEGVEWVTMEQICDDFKSKNKTPPGALLPAESDAILSNPGEWPGTGRRVLVNGVNDGQPQI